MNGPDHRGELPTCADAVPGEGPGRLQTIGEVLAFTDEQYRLYTAVHEIGHATAGLATGKCTVDCCELSIVPGAATDAYTDISWVQDRFEQNTRLVMLHGGLLAQDRWMKEQSLWTTDRYRAARSGARHDFAAMEELGANEAAVTAAREESQMLLAQHWPAVLKATDHLCTTGRITGGQLCDLLLGHLPGQSVRDEAPLAPSRGQGAVRGR